MIAKHKVVGESRQPMFVASINLLIEQLQYLYLDEALIQVRRPILDDFHCDHILHIVIIVVRRIFGKVDLIGSSTGASELRLLLRCLLL